MLGEFCRASLAVSNVEDHIKHLLETLKLEPADVDLIVDLGQVGEDESRALLTWIGARVADLPLAMLWRSLRLSGTGFPASLREVAPHSQEFLPRSHHAVWSSLVDFARDLPRTPGFADYCINCADQQETTGPVDYYTNLRYTDGDSWFICKGGLRSENYAEFNALCRDLLESSAFRGRFYSAGDKYLADCAAGLDGPGGGAEWRFAGTSHHIMTAIDQLRRVGR